MGMVRRTAAVEHAPHEGMVSRETRWVQLVSRLDLLKVRLIAEQSAHERVGGVEPQRVGRAHRGEVRVDLGVVGLAEQGNGKDDRQAVASHKDKSGRSSCQGFTQCGLNQIRSFLAFSLS